LVEIMLIEEIGGGGTLVGAMGKVTINDESFKIPTPTFS